MVESTSLYRKYRGRQFSEIVGQDHITQTLARALAQGKVSHAYLFTGPRGVGKTSVARILAHAINGLPYTGDDNHLDIIEIDAASNRRIDEMRELREKVHSAPTSAQFKVYIIDEVHMLTKEAFNALLKTLEEPPAHVVFILATTEAHKLPATISSRTQQHNFRPIEPGAVVKHLQAIAKKEKIDIDEPAFQLIAKQGGGSFRDSISLLDQVRHSADGQITVDDVRGVVGLAPAAIISGLVEALADNSTAIIDLVQQALEHGVVPAMLANQLANDLRRVYLDQRWPDQAEALLTLIDQLMSVNQATDPRLGLEVALLRGHLSLGSAQPDQPAAKTVPLQATPAKPVTKPQPKNVVVPKITAAPKATTEPNWQSFLQAVKNSNNTLYAALRVAQADFDGQTLLIKFKFPFHKARVDSAANRDILSRATSQVFGDNVTLNSIVDSSIEVEPPVDRQAQSLQRVVEAFGGGEEVRL